MQSARITFYCSKQLQYCNDAPEYICLTKNMLVYKGFLDSSFDCAQRARRLSPSFYSLVLYIITLLPAVVKDKTTRLQP